MGVFVCDDVRDGQAVRPLLSDLGRTGADVERSSEFDVSDAGWAAALARIRSCDAFIFALSETSIASHACRSQLEYARACNRPLIPVQVGRLGPTVDNPLSDLQHVDYLAPTVNSGIELTAALHDELRRATTPLGSEPESPPSPYGYLDELMHEVQAPELSAKQQSDVLGEISAHLESDGAQPAVRARLVEILELLYAHPELRARLRPAVAARLGASGGVVAAMKHRLSLRSRSGRVIAAASGVVVVVIAAIAVVLWAVPDDARDDTANAAVEVTTPPSETVTLTVLSDSILIGSSRAAAVVDVYNDPICSHCAAFINAHMEELARYVRSQEIAVRFHVMRTGDEDSSSADYSSRAAGAVYCVAAARDTALFKDYYEALFAPDFQPGYKPAPDHTSSELADLAVKVGAPRSVVECIRSNQEVEAARRRGDLGYAKLNALLQGDHPSYPQVLRGSDDLDFDDPNWLRNLVS